MAEILVEHMEETIQVEAAVAQEELEEQVLEELEVLVEHHSYPQFLDPATSTHMEVLVEHTHQIADMVTHLITDTEIMEQEHMVHTTVHQIIMDQDLKE
jgi:hypothetical protein